MDVASSRAARKNSQVGSARPPRSTSPPACTVPEAWWKTRSGDDYRGEEDHQSDRDAPELLPRGPRTSDTSAAEATIAPAGAAAMPCTCDRVAASRAAGDEGSPVPGPQPVDAERDHQESQPEAKPSGR